MKIFYQLELKQTTGRSYLGIRFFILVMQIVLFAFLFVRSDIYKELLFGAFIINVIGLLLFFFERKSTNKFSIIFSIILILTAVAWGVLGNILMGILLLILAIMNFYTTKKRVVVFSDEAILFPSFPAKKICWNEIENLVLKDDMLSIDLKNNILIQHQVSTKDSDELDVQAFNSFCKSKIS